MKRINSDNRIIFKKKEVSSANTLHQKLQWEREILGMSSLRRMLHVCQFSELLTKY